MKIFETIYGSLVTQNGYIEVGSTSERAVLPAHFENLHEQDFSSKYASLLSFRTEKANYWTAVHVQGEHVGSRQQGRVYDTRIFYNIDKENLRKCNFKIGAALSSLPPMTRFSEKNNNLNNIINPTDVPFSETNNLQMGLYKYIVQAIAEGKKLFIKLENKEDNYWKENKVLENPESKALFAAIDHLPEKLRPVASFALSVDHKLHENFLNHTLIVLHHCDRKNLKIAPKTAEIAINWSDLENNKDSKYVQLIDYYTTLTDLLVEQYPSNNKNLNFSDLFNSWLSSNQMLDGLFDENTKLENLERIDTISEIRAQVQIFYCNHKINKSENPPKYAKILLADEKFFDVTKKRDLIKTLSNDLYKNNQIYPEIEKLLINDLKNKVTKEHNFDLNDVYNVYRHHYKHYIAEIYAKNIVVEHCNDLSIKELISFWNETEQKICRENNDPLLINTLDKAIKNHIVSKKLSVDELSFLLNWNGSKQFIDKIKEETIKRGILFFDELLKNQTISREYKNWFKETDFYKNNAEELNHEPFWSYLPEEKKNILSKIKEEKKKKEEEEFEKMFLSNVNFRNSEIYKLFSSSRNYFPEINSSIINIDNLKIAWNNSKLIKLDLTNRVTELYNHANNIQQLVEIHKITNIQLETTSQQITISKIEDLENYEYLKTKEFATEFDVKFEVEKILRSLKPQKNKKENTNREILSKLHILGALNESHRSMAKSLLLDNKENKKFIISIVGEEPKIDEKQPTTFKNKFIQKNMNFVKNNKTLFIISAILLLIFSLEIATAIKHGRRATVFYTAFYNDSIIFMKKFEQEIIDSTAITEPEAWQQIINDTIYIYYEKCETDRPFNRSGTTDSLKIVKTFKIVNITHETYSDTIFKLKPFVTDSIIYKQKGNEINIRVDGQNTRTQLLNKILEIIAKTDEEIETETNAETDVETDSENSDN
ncbi:MAG: hypothetical protein FWH18_02510 [Marinilabiliaceae bacterium]|nr:hypothetical protein [Marinilabiliaceae bacterium]